MKYFVTAVDEETALVAVAGEVEADHIEDCLRKTYALGRLNAGPQATIRVTHISEQREPGDSSLVRMLKREREHAIAGDHT